jgi:DNA-binding response OmpR family regulator
MRLLVIEDEARIIEVLRAALSRAGFAVDAVATMADARAALPLAPYDAVILDLGLPDGDGLTLLTEMKRAGSLVPVLVLTARDAVEARVTGLDAGADDYLVKPFAMVELIARTKALLRRPGQALGTVLEAGNIIFDTIGRDVRVGAAVLALPRQDSPSSNTSCAVSAASCRRTCWRKSSTGSTKSSARTQSRFMFII